MFFLSCCYECKLRSLCFTFISQFNAWQSFFFAGCHFLRVFDLGPKKYILSKMLFDILWVLFIWKVNMMAFWLLIYFKVHSRAVTHRGDKSKTKLLILQIYLNVTYEYDARENNFVCKWLTFISKHTAECDNVYIDKSCLTAIALYWRSGQCTATFSRSIVLPEFRYH